MTATPFFSALTLPKYTVSSSFKIHLREPSPERPGIIISLLFFTSLAKNPRVHPLQSLVPNLQFHAVFPAHIPSRTLHHPANTLYSIIILSLDPRSLLISCFPTEPYQS